jgi:hypothetical protein
VKVPLIPGISISEAIVTDYGRGLLSYPTKGNVQAYVQYEQTASAGFQRMGLWPVDLFCNIAPPRIDR